MNWLSEPHRQQIFEELVLLEFPAPSAVLALVEPCDDPKDPLVKASILDCVSVSEGDETFFLVIKESAQDRWYIDQLYYSIQMEAPWREEGFALLHQKHCRNEGRLPNLQTVQENILRLVQEEKAKPEALFNSIRMELVQLGFDKDVEWVGSPRQKEGFIVFQLSEQLDTTLPDTPVTARFDVVISRGNSNGSPHLWMIRGEIVVDDGKSTPLRLAEQGFYKFNDHFPNKNQMTRDLVKMAKIHPDVYEEVRTRFRLGQPSLSSEHGRQPNRRRLKK